MVNEGRLRNGSVRLASGRWTLSKERRVSWPSRARCGTVQSSQIRGVRRKERATATHDVHAREGEDELREQREKDEELSHLCGAQGVEE